ncbi:hypothetical protein CEXT_325821 [Caerostris extrusa]|uniref:Uncharacterized protein n=1 Tax=Caerostris extrusa TaxID=172846 RepID=A0AAV4S7Y2_CAEEX|nr:hypothetical protein CEXT_325821 [Caerostris extrusa]
MRKNYRTVRVRQWQLEWKPFPSPARSPVSNCSSSFPSAVNRRTVCFKKLIFIVSLCTGELSHSWPNEEEIPNSKSETMAT